jgi:hypothetical protein
VFEALFREIHAQPNEQAHTLRKLKGEANAWLAHAGERFRLDERAVSKTLRTFGFGVVLIDRGSSEYIHELLSNYGPNSLADCVPPQSPGQPCEFCKALESEPKEPLSAEEVQLPPTPVYLSEMMALGVKSPSLKLP